MTTNILSAMLFVDKLRDEVEADIKDGKITRVRVEKGAHPVVGQLLELGVDYLTMSDGGHVRYVPFSSIASIQIVTNDETFIEMDRVPITGEVGG